MNVFARCEIVELGRNPEDGEVRYGQSWHVILERNDGFRWMSRQGFRSEEETVELQMQAFDEFMGEDIDWNEWVETYPCYGSPAYERIEPDLVAMERREDGCPF